MAAMLVGCGSGSSGDVSGLDNRAFVSNAYGGMTTPATGLVQIIDLDNDSLSSATISAGTTPGLMAETPAHDLTLVFDTSAFVVSVVNNHDESTAGSITLPTSTQSLVAPNSSIGFAALPTFVPSSTATVGGAVAQLDLVNYVVSNYIQVPTAQSVVMNHGANTLLVFSQNGNYSCPSGTGSALTVYSITSGTTSTICGSTNAPLDHPVWGAFSSDDSTAYIMNCGPECGGTNAGVTVLNMSTTPPSVTATLNFNASGAITPAGITAGATIGVVNGGNLYVAGTDHATAGHGTLTVLNVSSGTPVVSTTVSISDGYHNRIAIGANNKLFVGAAAPCTNTGNNGCLTIFDMSANTAVVDVAKGFVTGMAPVPDRNVVYVAEGGYQRIYSTSTNAEITGSPVGLVGTAVDVKVVDQAQPTYQTE